MAISDRLSGKKSTNGNPHIEALHPSAALPGGEVHIVGSSLRPQDLRQPRVRIGEVDGAVVISSDDFLAGTGTARGIVRTGNCSTNGHSSNPQSLELRADCGEPAPRNESRARRGRKYLRNFFRIARSESAGGNLQD